MIALRTVLRNHARFEPDVAFIERLLMDEHAAVRASVAGRLAIGLPQVLAVPRLAK
jgi:hypothetical protein